MTTPRWTPGRADLPGLALALGLAGVSVTLVKALPPSPLVSDVLLALFLGAALRNTPLGRLFGIGSGVAVDRYAAGLAFTGKWLLRLSIVLMGLKVQTSFFGRTEIATIFIVAAASIPSAFFVAHVLGVVFKVRRPLVDCLAGGTMICGASAVNAIAPACGARREEQGLAIAVVFLFSVTAMLSFRTIAFALGLDSSFAGLWSGLAVNDLASAVAVGAQMGGSGGVMSAAAKSTRILLLAPVLVAIALARRGPRASGEASGLAGLKKRILDALPGFIVGYVALALIRAAGDRVVPGVDAWRGLLVANKLVVDVLMSAVAAGIGLQLSVRMVLGSSAPAVAVGAGTSVWMAGLTVAMIALLARGHTTEAMVVGVVGLAASFLAHRGVAAAGARGRRLERRLAAGQVLTLDEGTLLLEAREQAGGLDEAFLERLKGQLRPSNGELAVVRSCPLDRDGGRRSLVYWEGSSGWSLVASLCEPYESGREEIRFSRP
jgi:uncharacterized membrane protein YadS